MAVRVAVEVRTTPMSLTGDPGGSHACQSEVPLAVGLRSGRGLLGKRVGPKGSREFESHSVRELTAYSAPACRCVSVSGRSHRARVGTIRGDNSTRQTDRTKRLSFSQRGALRDLQNPHLTSTDNSLPFGCG